MSAVVSLVTALGSERRNELPVDDGTVFPGRGGRPVGQAPLGPALEQLGEGGVGADMLAIAHFGHEAGQGLLGGPLRSPERPTDVTVLAAQRIPPGVDAQLELSAPRWRRWPFTPRIRQIPSPLIAIPAPDMTRGHSKVAPHLLFSWQPVRDSNPCLHLERVVS